MTVRSPSRRGFTLLELLVVIAILATIAGGLLVAYDGVESQAAKGQAANTIASLDNSVRAYTVSHRSAPNDLDGLLAVTPGSPDDGNHQVLAILGTKLGGKLTSAQLTQGQLDALTAAGITNLRYVDVAGNATTPGPHALSISDADGNPAPQVGSILEADIPNRCFDVPRPGSNRNRGRGFSGTLALGYPVLVWDAGGAGGINNTKLGAGPNDVLIAFGLGNNCSMMSDDPGSTGDVTLSSAPSYADVPKNTYSRYVLLYNVGPAGAELSKAKLQAVIDARGDFLDEELAEYSGQKQ